MMMAMIHAVKAKDLKWLPKGSEFYLESEDSNSNSTSKSKTYTSFTCSQDSLPEFSNIKIGFKEPLDDINIARLGPGQVIPPTPPPPLLLFPLILCFSFPSPFGCFWPLLVELGYVLFLSDICISLYIIFTVIL